MWVSSSLVLVLPAAVATAQATLLPGVAAVSSGVRSVRRGEAGQANHDGNEPG